MKKLLFFLFFSVSFFSCIPMEDVGNGDHLRIYIHNKTSQTINVDFSFDLEHRSLSYKNDAILPDSIPQLCGIGFKDVIGEKAILTLREEFHNKHLVIKKYRWRHFGKLEGFFIGIPRSILDNKSSR